MHFSVGALIEKDGKYLLIDRMNPPFGFAGIGGHVDEGEEDTIKALKREVKEESGLTATKCTLVCEEEIPGNFCKRGINTHYWYLYKCETTGEVVQNTKETKSIGWYSPAEMKKLELEPVWDYWFKKLEII